MRSRLFLDEMDIVNQDIKSIEREIKKLNPEDESDHDQLKADLHLVLEEANASKQHWLKKQQEAIAEDPKLNDIHDQQTKAYRSQVARSAVSCCLKISSKVEQIEDPDAFRELKIGIGSGPVLVGNFGSTDQIGFTVLGPSVNRSARLEPASAQVGCKILIDHDTYELLKPFEEFKFRRVPRIALAGFSKPIATYEPFFSDAISAQFLEAFDKGVAALEAGNNEEAKRHFESANDLRQGGDIASKLWIQKCEKAIQSGSQVGAIQMKK